MLRQLPPSTSVSSQDVTASHARVPRARRVQRPSGTCNRFLQRFILAFFSPYTNSLTDLCGSGSQLENEGQIRLPRVSQNAYQFLVAAYNRNVSADGDELRFRERILNVLLFEHVDHTPQRARSDPGIARTRLENR